MQIQSMALTAPATGEHRLKQLSLSSKADERGEWRRPAHSPLLSSPLLFSSLLSVSTPVLGTSVSVCVCARDNGKESEKSSLCVWVGERKRECVCVFGCILVST